MIIRIEIQHGFFFNGAHRSKWSNNDESAIIDQRSKRFAISNRSIGIFPLDSRMATFVAIGLCAKSVHPTLQLSHTMRTHADPLLSHICIYEPQIPCQVNKLHCKRFKNKLLCSQNKMTKIKQSFFLFITAQYTTQTKRRTTKKKQDEKRGERIN